MTSIGLKAPWFRPGWVSCLVAWLGLPGAATAQQYIPSHFEADGVYVRLPTRNGSLELYTDTGGGGLVLSRAAADRLHLARRPPSDDLKAQLGPGVEVAPPPVLAHGLPPLPAPATILARPRQISAWPDQADGFLGAPWFAGGVWTWDFPARRLIKQPQGWSPPASARIAPLGFKLEPDGSRTTNFPRVSVRVSGEDLPMLLDTGAETYLTRAAIEALGGGPALRATSMVSAAVFDRWRARHADWRHLAMAQQATDADMIEARDVEIAGARVERVWFTRRPDANYRDFMSLMTDAPVLGSIGDNALCHFRITLDYPAARLAVESPSARGSAGCQIH